VFRRPSLGIRRSTVGTFFGELALIVIGVLLALSVDEWRQARARQVAGEEALQSVRVELASNRDLAVESRDYHVGRMEYATDKLRSGQPLAMSDFPDGFINPARCLDAAWETARESGELKAVNRELHRTIAVAYAHQDRYEEQIRSVSALIYQQLHEDGRNGMLGNAEGLLFLISTFIFREDEIIDVFDETLAAIDAR
jgi:hypothetical protein